MSIMRFLLPLVLVLATCWARDPIFEEVQPVIFDYTQEIDYKLPPSGVRPTNYEITLQPYFDVKGKEFSFDGNVNITLDREELETKAITLHYAANLTNIEAVLQYYSTVEIAPLEDNELQINTTIKRIKPTNITYESHTNFITLNFEDNIPLPSVAENFTLALSYTGTLIHDDLYGFYRSSYGEGDDEEWLATTQFEPIYARRAFPCWDEPDIKATFDIIIKHPSDYTAISNMGEKPKKKDTKKKGTQDNNDIVETRFETTPKMSTYLVAFVISKFNDNSNSDKDFTIWTKPGDEDSTEFALDNGQEILVELESYTNIKYYTSLKPNENSMHMSKMDQVSIPQFPAGAMENWGLVTYREPLLLSMENVTSTRGIQDTMTVIAHEFAHQWFGNLVTPKWWNHIWLSEGFATFFQYFIPDNIQGEEWRLMDQFVIKVMQGSAFVTDASAVTHSLDQDAPSPEQILHLFDNIAYKKGACVIRMMQHVLTETHFQNALKQYLKNNMHESVSPKELYKAMQDEIDKNTKPKIETPVEIEIITNSWVTQPGYPVITVKINNKTGDATITQQRFFLSGPSSVDKTKWYIPINYVTQEDPAIKDTATKAKAWLESTKSSTSIKKVVKDKDKWVIFNNLQTGYYRVNYEESNWNYLAAYLNTDNYNNIHPVSRAQLIDDSMNLARAGYLSYTSALPITNYLHRETDYIPWYAAFRAFDYLDRNLQGMKNYENLQNYIVQKLNAYANMVEFTDTPKNTTYFYQLGRELALEMSCTYGFEECLKYTQQRLSTWLSDNKNELPVDLQYGILCAGVRQADQKTWNTTLEKYKNSTDPNEKVMIWNALGCAQHKEVIQTFLEVSLQDKIEDIDIFDTINIIATNNYKSFDVVMDFIFENIEEIYEKDNDTLKLTANVNQLSSQIINNEQYGKMLLLAIRGHIQVDHNFPGWFKGKENLDWIERNQQVISKWVEENYHPPKGGNGNSATSITSMSFLMVISVLIARFY
ncbi:aminopeptidase N-like [Odontomachus brunneus]|uniref:aminopeptidase N-like n=1 Tax=Odontomachus brunneus TaxID=486640 RepID=UPI0013F25956|nr:aminopeptidase N-like [Odontomachus brunneus]